MTRHFVFAAALIALAGPAHAADPVDGRWVTEERDAVISITDCGKSKCGRIAKFLVAPPQGASQRDVNNSDPKLRNRMILGMPVLTGFTDEGKDWRGRIYDPKSGKTYRSILRRIDANTLQVKGCLGPFCQTQTWKRAR